MSSDQVSSYLPGKYIGPTSEEVTEKFGEALDMLAELSEDELLVGENINAVCSCPDYANRIAIGLCELWRADILSDENRNAILTSPEHADYIAEGIAKLYQSDLLNVNTRQFLLSYPQHAEEIATSLCNLAEVNLLTDSNREILLAQPEYAASISSGFCALQASGLLTTEYRSVLLAHPPYAASISSGFCALQASGLLTTEYRSVLLAHPVYAESIGTAFAQLNDAKLLTDENRQAVLAHMEFSADIARSIAHLHRANLLTPERRKYLIDQSNTASKLSECIVYLDQMDLLTEENENTLLADSTKVEKLGFCFFQLNRLNIATNANGKQLLSNIGNIPYLAESISLLEGGQSPLVPDLRTVNNVQTLVNNLSQAKPIALIFQQVGSSHVSRQYNIDLVNQFTDEGIIYHFAAGVAALHETQILRRLFPLYIKQIKTRLNEPDFFKPSIFQLALAFGGKMPAKTEVDSFAHSYNMLVSYVYFFTNIKCMNSGRFRLLLNHDTILPIIVSRLVNDGFLLSEKQELASEAMRFFKNAPEKTTHMDYFSPEKYKAMLQTLSWFDKQCLASSNEPDLKRVRYM